ncbi:MAG: hypothetical protein F6K00_16325 [Leptolyngbya sp. SIOISBB]|nr:hypothetical protein [Leptolyngbya sp. SIOISBB]
MPRLSPLMVVRSDLRDRVVLVPMVCNINPVTTPPAIAQNKNCQLRRGLQAHR